MANSNTPPDDFTGNTLPPFFTETEEARNAREDAELLAELERVDAEGLPEFRAAQQRAQLRAAREKRLTIARKRIDTKRANATLNVDLLDKDTLGKYLAAYRDFPIERFIRDVLIRRDGHGNQITTRGFKQIIAKPVGQRFFRYMKYRYRIIVLQERIDTGTPNKTDKEELKRILQKAERLYRSLPAYLQWRAPRKEYVYHNITISFTRAVYSEIKRAQEAQGLKTVSGFIRAVLLDYLGMEHVPDIDEQALDAAIEADMEADMETENNSSAPEKEE